MQDRVKEIFGISEKELLERIAEGERQIDNGETCTIEELWEDHEQWKRDIQLKFLDEHAGA